MVNQPVRELDPFRLWDNLHQIFFHFFRRLRSRQTQPVRKPKNVRVYHNAGRNSIGSTQDDVRRFARDTRQGQEFLHRLRDTTFELRQKTSSGSLDILGLIPEKAR